MSTSAYFAALPLLLLLQGCAPRPVEIADPNAITLRSAVLDVAETLHAAREKYRNKPKVGMYPSEAVVTFNIASTSTETTGLQVGASIPAAVSVVPITASLSDQVVTNGTRGNQITIKFKNVIDLKSGGGKEGESGNGKEPGLFGTAPAPAPPRQKTSSPPVEWTKCLGEGPHPSYCDGVITFMRKSETEKQRLLQEQQAIQPR